MNKTQTVIVALKAGKSDEEILSEFSIQKPFLSRCKTYWKKEQSTAIAEIEGKIETVTETPTQQESAIIQEAPTGTITTDVSPDLLAAFANFLQSQAKPVAQQLKSCSRHPNETVDAGTNCPHCLKQSQVDNERMKNSRILPPCPKCKESKAFAYGGVIRKTKKAHHYVCGQCEITYNIKGESTEWASGKDSHVI